MIVLFPPPLFGLGPPFAPLPLSPFPPFPPFSRSPFFFDAPILHSDHPITLTSSVSPQSLVTQVRSRSTYKGIKIQRHKNTKAWALLLLAGSTEYMGLQQQSRGSCRRPYGFRSTTYRVQRTEYKRKQHFPPPALGLTTLGPLASEMPRYFWTHTPHTVDSSSFPLALFPLSPSPSSLLFLLPIPYSLSPVPYSLFTTTLPATTTTTPPNNPWLRLPQICTRLRIAP